MGAAVKRLLLLVLVALAYFGTARLGLLLASLHDNVSPVWPATGLAAAVLLLGGRWLWPGVMIGAFANARNPRHGLIRRGDLRR
jgi:integral membrane sensor domain MASE1